MDSWSVPQVALFWKGQTPLPVPSWQEGRGAFVRLWQHASEGNPVTRAGGFALCFVPVVPLASSFFSHTRCGKTVCAPRLEQTTNPRHVFSLSLFPCLHMLEMCSICALSVWYKQSTLGHQRRWQQTVCMGATKIFWALVKQVPLPDFQTLLLGGGGS